MVGLPLRRALAGTTTLVVPMVLSLGFGHRGAHAARNLLLPGAGLIDERRALGALFVLATVGSVVVWMRWGADWMVLMVLATSIALSLGLRPAPSLHASPVGPVQAAHEFPVVVLVVGARCPASPRSLGACRRSVACGRHGPGVTMGSTMRTAWALSTYAAPPPSSAWRATMSRRGHSSPHPGSSGAHDG